jgi:hypothetical protein
MAGGDRRDDALSWDGDDDPTLDTGGPEHEPEVAVPVEPAPADRVDAASAAVTDADTDADEDETDERPGLSNAGLIAIGVLGGVYALLAVGWIVGGLRLQEYALFFIAPVAFQVSLWLAVLAPVIWFVTVFLLTRDARAWLRYVLLVAGALLLLPWPFVMLGAVGQ